MTEVSYTKLFSSITDSTIWGEDAETRIIWITMLAMSDSNGWVYSSIPGLARRARVSIEKTEEALHKFMQPDKYSRTPDHEGRRIELIDGGWGLLNHDKYRSIRNQEERRLYQRDWMRKKRKEDKAAKSDKNALYVDKTVDKRGQSRPRCTNTDTDTNKAKDNSDFDKSQSSTAKPKNSKAFASCPTREILKLWQKILPEKPQPRDMSGTRGVNLRNRWIWLQKNINPKTQEFYFTDVESGLIWFGKFFRFCHKSDFIMNKQRNFTLPWVVVNKNFLKIIEGNYHGS